MSIINAAVKSRNPQPSSDTDNAAPERHAMDFALFISVIILCAFGVVMLFSASYYYAQSEFSDGYYYVKKQLLFLMLGVPGMFGISLLNYRFYYKYSGAAYLFLIVMLALCLLIGTETQGGQRWIDLKLFQFQPAELAKFIIVLCTAKYMTKYKKLMPTFLYGIIIPVVVFLLIPCIFIYFQPNMSMVIIACAVMAVMLFLGGTSLKQLGIVGLLGVIGLFFLTIAKGYRGGRLETWLDPWSAPQNGGYQVIQSLYALGNGGFFGQGFDASRQKLLFLPERECDYIIPIIGEELGFITLMLLLLLYLFVIYRGVLIALRCKDRFGCLLAAGITAILAVQTLINAGIATNLLPATGQNLPFISAGGTSLLIFLFATGILLNVSRYTELKK